MDTIGILCSPGRETAFLRTLPSRLRALFPQEQAAVLVFTMPDVRLGEGTADGIRITAQGSLPCRAPLPAVIFNLTVQRHKEDIRKMRALMELSGTRVFNPSNWLSQRAVREMLLADPDTAPLVPPEAGRADLDSLPAFVRLPAAGMHLGRTTCACRTPWGWNLYNWNGVPLSQVSSAAAAVGDARSNGWLTLRLPGLTVSGSRPVGTRSCLQRSVEGKWETLLHIGLWERGRTHRRPDPETERALLGIARQVGCYLPDMVLCTVDLLCGPDGGPLFLSLGGWWPGLLGAYTGIARKTCLCRNLLGYSRLNLYN